MGKLRLWVCKKLYNSIEKYKERICLLNMDLERNLKHLTPEEFLLFGIKTGYIEKKRINTSQKKKR